VLTAVRSAHRAAQDAIHSGTKAVGATGTYERPEVDSTALAQRDDRFATQSENSGDAVTARAETADYSQSRVTARALLLSTRYFQF